MITDINSNKKLNPIITELFLRARKINISVVFVTQSYIKVPKEATLNNTLFFLMKISNRRELQQVATSHLSDIDFKYFMKIYQKCTAEKHPFLGDDTTLPSDNPLRFTKILLE